MLRYKCANVKCTNTVSALSGCYCSVHCLTTATDKDDANIKAEEVKAVKK